MLRKSKDYDTFINTRNNRKDLVDAYNSLLKTNGRMSFSAFVRDIVPAYARLAHKGKANRPTSDQRLYEKFLTLSINSSSRLNNGAALLKANEHVQEENIDEIEDW